MKSNPRATSCFVLTALVAFALCGCEDDPVRGLQHSELEIISFESALSDVEADASRNLIYVADERTNQIHLIDAASDALIRSIDVGSRPIRIVLEPGGDNLFVALQGERSVAVVDPDLGEVIRRVVVPFEVGWLDVTGDGRLFVGPRLIDDGETLSMDAVTGEVLHQVNVSAGWSPVGEFVAVQDSILLLVRTDDLFKWNIQDRDNSAYVGRAELDLFHSRHELTTSQDGELLYISGTLGRANQVEVFRISNLTKAGAFDTQQGVQFACLSPDGNRAFVATSMQSMAQGSSATTYLLEYSTTTYSRRDQYQALGNMVGTSLTVSPDGSKLYAVVNNPYRISDNPNQERRQDLQVIGLR